MRGRRQKPITKEQCLKAMDATKSVKAAARYLGHSYDHIKQYLNCIGMKPQVKHYLSFIKTNRAKALENSLIKVDEEMLHSWT
jgi:hypothetical protein